MSVKQKLEVELFLTRTRQASTRQNVPDRPMPALQCITGGPWTVVSRAPAPRTAHKKSRKAPGEVGTPKSGHAV